MISQDDATGKTMIIFIGDFKYQETVDLLLEFIDRYAEHYNISVTGYNFASINNIEKVRSNSTICGMSQARHFYDKYVAEYVVITTPAPRYMRTKRTQRIIYILPDFDERSFAGCMSDVFQVVTGNEQVQNRFAEAFPHIDVEVYEGESTRDRIRSIVDKLKIREGIPEGRKQYLLVTDENNFDVTRDVFGVGRYLERVAAEGYNDVIALSNRGGIGCVSGSVTFGNEVVVRSILGEFRGTIVFGSKTMKCVFDTFVQENNIELKAEKLVMLQDLQLLELAEAANETAWIEANEDLSDYQKYRHIIDKIYVIKECERFKVSVIICRYNTPFDLLVRAVESAFNCGHPNIEVVLVDDGSETSLEAELLERFNGLNLSYYYKQNEGLGLSRNFGIQVATGDYVFFLDSDDTIHPNGMSRLVAHASFYNLDMVIGRRVLCDESGTPLSESFGNLSGSSYKCYYSDGETASVYSDVMVNNLLLKHDFLMSYEIQFSRGLYEDVEYSARLYSSISEYHYVSTVIHDWYQYKSRETISSDIEAANMRERIVKEESSWSYVPERARNARIKTILQVNFNRYFARCLAFDEAELAEIWKLLKGFVAGKEKYIDWNGYTESTKELAKAVVEDSFGYFRYVLNRYYASSIDNVEPHDNYVILTHYHLYVACLYAIKNKKKARLFICQSYVPFDTNLIYSIKSTGLFESVTPFVYGNIVGGLFQELEARPGEEDIVIPNYLYGMFANIFRQCNTHDDNFYIFSDTHPYWYYLDRECENIIKLEDAYNSFDREVKTFEMQGIWAGIQKYEGSLYPQMYFKSEKVKKIVISNPIEDLPSEYASRIEVLDTKQLEREYYEDIKQVMLKIYPVDTSAFTEDATMLLTQPLALFGYCTHNEQKRLMRRMVAPYSEGRLLIKPHPADNMDYKYLKGTILPKQIPIEAYNFMDKEIARVVTFGSSAIETVKFAREKKVYFRLHDFEFDDVVAAAKKLGKAKRKRSKGKAGDAAEVSEPESIRKDARDDLASAKKTILKPMEFVKKWLNG